MTDIELDPYSRSFTEDPYPIYRRLRDEAPLHYDPGSKAWWLSRYDDIFAAQRDHEALISSEGASLDGRDRGIPYLVLKDQPEHSWYKAVVTRVFTPGKMAKLERMIRARAIELIQDCAGREEFDLVEDFAVRLPLDIISELIDIPQEHREDVRYWTMVSLRRGADYDQALWEESHRRRAEIYMGLIAERRRAPRDDAITMLINLEVKDEDGANHHLDDRTLSYHFLELALAGHETVSRLIPNGALALHHFPEERAKLAADATLIPNAVEEFLRYDAPVQFTTRVTSREISLHGQRIDKGERIAILMGSAGRDERMFADPDRLDVTRPADVRSIYFGSGIHKCLGIHLARLEARIAFEELFRMLPDFSVDPARAVRYISAGLRGPAKLPTRPGLMVREPVLAN